MPRHARELAASGIYHVLLRGVNRDVIFLEDEDRMRFLHAVAKAKELSGCRVLAYCLMSNHVHLVLRTGDEELGAVVKRIGVRYAGWFNRKYGRVGHLFQDRFKSVAVDDDAYLLTLIGYVWDNPVAAGLVVHAEDYRWGSRSLLGRSSIVDEDELRRLLSSRVLTELSSAEAGTSLEALPGTRGRRPAHTTSEAAGLLAQACGAASPEQFQRLSRSTQCQAIRELRTRSVSYDRIAEVTGLSASRVRREHIAGDWTAQPVS
ncbi:transposase [Propionicimonas sp.]|uniref:transposase n=1 Tax=Propionicimonas sp. TaxID=1955623 RepID=UPI0039E32B06